jgi:hypothetical protein
VYTHPVVAALTFASLAHVTLTLWIVFQKYPLAV